MRNIILGIGDLKISNKPGDIIKTFALGSCVAVIVLAPKTRTVGMAHVALPKSADHCDAAVRKPGYFADIAIPALLEKMGVNGNPETRRGVIVKLAGGAVIMDPHNVFEIGKRNILAVKKCLWKYGLGPLAEDVGGTISRTVSVSIDTGQVTLSSGNRKVWAI